MGVRVHVLQDLGEERGGGVDDDETAVHEAQGPGVGVWSDGLGEGGLGVLGGEGAVGGDPVFRVVWLVEGVADACVAGGEDTLRGVLVACFGEVGLIEVQGHEFVHVLAHEHVGVELHDPGVLGQVEGG